MTIASLIAYPLAVPQVAGSGRAGSVFSLVVEVTTTDGRFGFGEALSLSTPRAAAAVVEDVLAPLLLKADESRIGALWERMRAGLAGPMGGAAAEALSAVDIALWDLQGRTLGAPIGMLIGGIGRVHLAAYGSFVGWVDDQAAAAQAERAVRLGFRSLKVKLQPPLAAALARTGLIRDVVGGDIGLCADPNGAFGYDDALRLARGLAESEYLWLEEPVDPAATDSLARLAGQNLITIAAGESESTPRGALQLAMAGAAGLLQPDVGRIGGITGFCRAAGAAALLGVPFAPHHAGGAIKAAASLHVAAALPGFTIMECSLFRTALHDELTLEPVAHPDLLDGEGRLPVPQAPGLGIEINRTALRTCRLH